MKLGDNMTAVEACNIWGDGCSRKARPPRIGEIPRYIAVDEESPGTASRRLASTSPCSETRPTEGMLELRLSTHGDVFAAKTSPVQKSQKCDDEESRVPECTRLQGIGAEIPSVTVMKDVTRLQLETDKPLTESRETEDRGNLVRISSAPSQEIREIRKDSALYLEEVEGLKDLRESLRARSPRSLTPRRESSGYASNLGTFDDERRPSEIDLTAVHERRRSSAKRLTSETFLPRRISRNEENLNVGDAATTAEKISAPQDVERRVSTAGLDMSDIAEVRDAEFDERIEARYETETEFIAPVHLPVSKETISDITAKGESRGSNNPQVHSTGAPGSSGEILSYAEVLAKSGTPPSRGGVNRPRILSRVESFDAGDFTGKITHNAIVNQLSTKVQMPRKRIVHQYSTPNFSSMELESILEKPADKSPEKPENFSVENRPATRVTVEVASEPNGPESVEERRLQTAQDPPKTLTTESPGSSETAQMTLGKNLPRSVKVYQLLSTQSEDRGDGVPNLADRRISLQISRQEDDQLGTSGGDKSEEEKKEGPDVSISEGNSTLAVPCAEAERSSAKHLTPTTPASSSVPVRKLSTPAEMGSSQRLLADSGIGIRPIYPYCPYSPYGSPQGSPRTRRRPLRESRRVSIDNRQGALQLNQYKLLDNIGQGSYGIVKLAYNEEDKTHYAMKILSKKKLMKKAGIFGRMAPGRKGLANPLAKVYREIALLKKLDHPNVVKLVEVLDDPDEDNLYLAFELVQKGEVLQLPTDDPFDEETARSHFRDIVLGVEYLHYQRIVHRDIKPSNLLVDSEGHIKVADLGVSAELRAAGELLSGPAGTPAFAAPETTTPGAQYSGTMHRVQRHLSHIQQKFVQNIVQSSETGGKTGREAVQVVLCDVWSMGVTLYSLVTGRVPWDGAGSIIGVQAAVRTEPLRFPEKPELSDSLKDLITKMLEKEPDSRISLTDIKNDPWVTKNGTEILPSETENCRLPVTVTDEEVARVVTRVPKLDTLILIKTMLKQHSFQNPFLPKRSTKSVCSEAMPSGSSSVNIEGSEVLENSNSRTQKFHKAGRSNSAPDTFDCHPSDRQVSVESPLPPVTEALVQESDSYKR